MTKSPTTRADRRDEGDALPFVRRRLGALAAVSLVVLGAFVSMLVHGTRPSTGPSRAALGLASVGFTDLAISSNSRWLRHPSDAEPAAACAESLVCLDTDPAGAALPRPTTFFAPLATRVEVSR